MPKPTAADRARARVLLDRARVHAEHAAEMLDRYGDHPGAHVTLIAFAAELANRLSIIRQECAGMLPPAGSGDDDGRPWPAPGFGDDAR